MNTAELIWINLDVKPNTSVKQSFMCTVDPEL